MSEKQVCKMFLAHFFVAENGENGYLPVSEYTPPLLNACGMFKCSNRVVLV
ncbi:hypothetical protein DSECCO2_638070 [anaerobic digester metagenome]|nr:hypothetical protein [Lentimicrobiaceae bacterium]